MIIYLNDEIKELKDEIDASKNATTQRETGEREQREQRNQGKQGKQWKQGKLTHI